MGYLIFERVDGRCTCMAHILNSTYVLKTSLSRELCLRFFLYRSWFVFGGKTESRRGKVKSNNNVSVFPPIPIMTILTWFLLIPCLHYGCVMQCGPGMWT